MWLQRRQIKRGKVLHILLILLFVHLHNVGRFSPFGVVTNERTKLLDGQHDVLREGAN